MGHLVLSAPRRPRYVILGAGAVGGVLGAHLHEAGHEVVLVARGEHLRCLERDGLCLRTPHGARVVRARVIPEPAAHGWAEGDVAVLAVKSQDTEAALDALYAAVLAAGVPDIPIVCCQNGVSNERAAAARFPRVYGMLTLILATHLEPGVVLVHNAPRAGVFDLGCALGGTDALTTRLAQDLGAAALLSLARPDVMDWKRAKLLMNLGNVVNAACGPLGPAASGPAAVIEAARQEGLRAFAAAGLGVVPDSELRARFAELLEGSPYGAVDGRDRHGGSTWQSLARGAPLEVPHLNGEIVRLGHEHGLATPANAGLLKVAERLSGEARAPGSMSAEELCRLVAEG